jgi:hypothetical protein
MIVLEVRISTLVDHWSRDLEWVTIIDKELHEDKYVSAINLLFK